MKRPPKAAQQAQKNHPNPRLKVPDNLANIVKLSPGLLFWCTFVLFWYFLREFRSHFTVKPPNKFKFELFGPLRNRRGGQLNVSAHNPRTHLEHVLCSHFDTILQVLPDALTCVSAAGTSCQSCQLKHPSYVLSSIILVL